MRQLDDRAEQVGLGHSLFAVLLIGLMTAGVLHPTDGSLSSSTARAQYRVVELQEKVGPRRGITCPAGSVLLRRVRTIQKVIDRRPEGTTFCFKSKTYFLRSPIVPKSGDGFVGKFGAILDGRRWHTSADDVGAFTGTGHSVNDVTIRNLVIRNMPQKGIATAYDANSNWTIDHNEISGARTGVSFPDYSTVTANFNGGNGIWFDTANTGVLIEGNTVSVNMRYGKAISMEKNNGTAVIRNNSIRVGSRGEVGIILNNSSNVEVYDNTVTMASTSEGGAINVFFDASRTGWDTMNNHVTNNTVVLRRSATITASVSCYNVTDCSPYWTTAGNRFQGNTYRVPNQTGSHWVLSSAVTWSSWQAAGFDTSGTIISP